MSFLNRLFGEAPQQRTMLDAVQDVGGRLIVKGYRNVSAQWGGAPTSKTSDQTIMAIYSQVGTAFHEAEKRRGEHIPALYLNYIVLHFLQLHETLGQHFQEHLEYKVNKYLAEGLREDYKQELRLIDDNSNDPDVTHLKELQTRTEDALFPVKLIELVSAELIPSIFGSASRVGTAVTLSAAVPKHPYDNDLLLKEVAGFHMNVAISVIMKRMELHGKEYYDVAEKSIWTRLDVETRGLDANLGGRYYAPILAKDVLDLSRAYFIKDAEFLGVCKADIIRYANRYNPRILEFAPDLMAPVFYVLRVSHIMNVEGISYESGKTLADAAVRKILMDWAEALETKLEGFLSSSIR